MAVIAKANFECIMMMNDIDAEHYIPTISSANLEAIQLAKNQRGNGTITSIHTM